MKIYASRVLEIPDRIYEQFFNLLDRKRQEKVKAIKHREERLRSVSAGLLLSHRFLEAGFGEDAGSRLEFEEGSYGKP